METGKESDIPEAFDMVMIDHEKVVRRRHAKESKKSIVKVTVKVTMKKMIVDQVESKSINV